MSAQLLAGAVRRLLSWPTFTALVGPVVGQDTGLGGAFGEGWVFQGLSPEGGLYRDVQGSGRCAVVLTIRGQWGVPNRHNTATFPQLQALIYADPTRGANGDTLARDADLKCWSVWEAVRTCFHDPGNVVHSYDGVPVVASLCSQDLQVTDVPGADGTVRGLGRFDVSAY